MTEKVPAAAFPPGGVAVETCSICTHHAEVTIFESQALERQMVAVPAWKRASGEMGTVGW
jgi:hypothetical protein